jgi:hypothetical protein
LSTHFSSWNSGVLIEKFVDELKGVCLPFEAGLEARPTDAVGPFANG